MTAEELEFMHRFVAERRWQFAKTMPENQHRYTVREWVPDGRDDFERFVVLLRQHGSDEVFRGRTYRYLDLDGFHYWTMGAPISQTTVINRKRLPLDANGHSLNPDRQED